MNKTVIILRHELSKTVRKKAYIAMTLALPVLALIGMLLFQILQGIDFEGQGPRKAGYVDQSGLFTGYTEQPDIAFVAYQSEAEATSALLQGEISEYYLISPDYLASGLITRYVTKREYGPSTGTMKQLEDFLISNLLAGEVSDEKIERAKTPAAMVSWRLDESGTISPTGFDPGRFVMPYLFGILLAMSIFTSSSYLLQGIAEEKESRVMEILLSSVSPRQLLTGKVLGLGTAGLLQIVVWLIFAWATVQFFSSRVPAIGLSLPINLLILMVVYFLLGYLLFAVLMAGLGAITSTSQESSQISVYFSLIAMIPLWVAQLIYINPDHPIFRALTVFPLTAPLAAMIRVSVAGVPAWELALSVLVLAGSVVGGMFLTSRVFRVYLLMYGKRPGIRELWRNVSRA